MALLAEQMAAGGDAGAPPDARPEGEIAAPPHHMLPSPDVLDKLERWSDPLQTPNIATEILAQPDGAGLLGAIGQRVVRHHEIDDASRSEWLKKSREAIKLATMVAEDKSYPWPNASNVVYPLMSTAAVQFAARAYPAIISGADVVKGTVFGEDDGVPLVDPNGRQLQAGNGQPLWILEPGAKRARAERIGQHMSWQLLEEQPEWEEETDKLLLILPIVGCCFRKIYFDSGLARNMAVLVKAEHLVINYWAKSLDTAPRLTEEIKLYPLEIVQNYRADLFLDESYGMAADGGEDEDAPHDFLEQHCNLDLDEDGYHEPYVVTVHRATGKVARICARYDMEGVIANKRTGDIAKVEPVQYYTKYDFLPNPDGGIYGMGFGQTLLPLNESVNTTLNQLFDAGHLANTGGGFIGRHLSTKSGSLRFRPGEFKVVNVPGRTIRESVVPLQFPGPSEVLFKLLGFLVEASKEVSSNTELLSGRQNQANVPASTTLALIEQGLKVFTAVYKRIYRSLKSEFDKQYRLNRLYLDDVAGFRRGEVWQTVRRDDYEAGSAVQPVADPSMVSDMQQLARAEFLKEFTGDPLVEQLELRRRLFDAAKVERPEELLVKQLPPNPEVLKAAKELEIKEMTGRADALASMAKAVLDLARADAVDGETEMDWIRTQFEILKEQIANGGAAGTGNTPGAGGRPAPGDQPAAVPVLAQ